MIGDKQEIMLSIYQIQEHKDARREYQEMEHKEFQSPASPLSRVHFIHLSQV
jgi:hypothetical protein